MFESETGHRHDGRSAAERYDRAYPAIPVPLVEALIRLADLRPDRRLLAVGAGTGKGILPLTATGCEIVALEPDPDLAAFATYRFTAFPEVTVVTADLDTWPLPAEPFDAVFAADPYRRLHPGAWVDKAAQALRVGGALAAIEVHRLTRGDDRFFVALQDCHRRFGVAELESPAPAADQLPRRPGTAGSGWFEPPEFHRSQWSQTYTASQYVDLLMVSSRYRQLPAPVRYELLECVSQVIDQRFGGRIIELNVTQLWVVRRRAERTRRGREPSSGDHQ